MSGATSGIAFVTGAGSGIGRAVAIHLATHGWVVGLGGRRRDALEETENEITAYGGESRAIALDVTDEASVERAFATVSESYGRLDLLFNNAGTNVAPAAIDSISLTDWNHVLTTNLTGSFLCARQAFEIMRRQKPGGGRIINNGSVSAHVPRPGSAPYTASKHAITGLTRAIALDGRKFGIACGQIDVGNARTGMADRMSSGTDQADGEIRPEATMPVADVGAAVAFMAGLSLESNVQFMTLLATTMPYVGRG